MTKKAKKEISKPLFEADENIIVRHPAIGDIAVAIKKFKETLYCPGQPCSNGTVEKRGVKFTGYIAEAINNNRFYRAYSKNKENAITKAITGLYA